MRVIFGNIDIFLANRLNHNVFANRNGYLVIALQIAVLVSRLAHALHGIHHIGLLHFDSFAKLVRPGRVFCEFSQNIRERNQRYDRFVITQFRIFNGFRKVIPLQVPMGLGKSGCARNVITMHRRIQDMHQKRIRVKRNRRHKCVQFRWRVAGLGICHQRERDYRNEQWN